MARHPNSLKNLKPPFEKGHPPLKGCGKPKGSKSITTALIKLLQSASSNLPLSQELAAVAKQFNLNSVAEVLALKMVSLSFSQSPAIALSAIKESMDRTEGQAQQNISVQNYDYTKLSDEQLRAIAAGSSLSSVGVEEAE